MIAVSWQRLGISIPDIQKAISQYYQKEFLGTGNVETQLATSCKEGQSSQVDTSRFGS